MPRGGRDSPAIPAAAQSALYFARMYSGASTHGARPHGCFAGRSLPDAHAAHTALTVTFVPLRFISTSVHPPSTSI